MIKFIGLVRHREDVSRETLYGRWVTVHAPHITAVAQPLRYVLTFFEPGPDGPDPASDGMAEIWVRDLDHYETTMGAQAPASLGADRFVEYFDVDRYRQFLADEHCIVDALAPPPARKRCGFVRRRTGVDRGELQRAWLETHAPNAAAGVRRTPGALRYVVNTAIDAEAPFDGLAEVYFQDADAVAAGLDGVGPDGFGALLDPDQLVMLTGREIVVVEGGSRERP